jgi:hypothetical protein
MIHEFQKKTITGIATSWSLKTKSNFLHSVRHNERFASAANKENTDVAITLQNGGKSKRAMSQLGTTMGRVFNGMVKKISSKAGLSTLNCVRAAAFTH